MFLVLAIVFVFATCVFLNWALFCFTLPSLIKMIFGTETVFTRSGLSLLNTSFFAIMVGLTYLCVDPLAKMVFVLRCFYGQSRESGADLKAELKHYAALAGQVAAALALLLVGAPDNAGALERPNTTATPGIISPVTPVSVFLYQTAALDAPAGETAASATLPRDAGEGTAAGVAPHELGRAIEKVLEQRKFAWRMPREKIEKPKTESGVIGRFFERVSETLRKWLRELREWLADWLRKLLRNRWHRGTTSGSGYGWILALQLLLYGLLAFTVGALAVLVYRITRGPRNKRPVVAAQSILPTPDLADENVGAEQLPEDGWTRLGRELLERGELRLALRAFYLASLAHLAARNLIHLAKFKSNSDYEQELRRRGHSFPGLLARFTENVQVFDRVWYGMHQINTEVLNQFVARVEQLKAG